MREESQQIEEKKIHRKVLLAVSEIMLYMIPLILQGVERLIFYLPAASAAPNQFSYILFIYGNISYPTVVIAHFLLIHQPVFKVICRNRLFIAV